MSEKEKKLEEDKTAVEHEEQDKVILTIKEEYERQIAQLKEEHKKEIQQIKDEAEERTIKQIKALMSGRQETAVEQEEQEDYTEESFVERAVNETLNILQGGKK